VLFFIHLSGIRNQMLALLIAEEEEELQSSLVLGVSELQQEACVGFFAMVEEDFRNSVWSFG
jgi:hypothetical protein